MNTALICLKHYVQMSLFYSSPANLPAGRNCVILSLFAYVAVAEILLGDKRGLLAIVAQIAIEVFILSAISIIILRLINKPERLLQTLSALIGVSLIISIVSILIMSQLIETTDEAQTNPVAFQIYLILLLWNLAVISLIFKRAFELRTAVAGFIAFNYFIFNELILINFFRAG